MPCPQVYITKYRILCCAPCPQVYYVLSTLLLTPHLSPGISIGQIGSQPDSLPLILIQLFCRTLELHTVLYTIHNYHQDTRAISTLYTIFIRTLASYINTLYTIIIRTLASSIYTLHNYHQTLASYIYTLHNYHQDTS